MHDAECTGTQTLDAVVNNDAENLFHPAGFRNVEINCPCGD